MYLLPRGEQRALLLLSLLLILGIIARATVQLLPDRVPPGMEEFVQESRSIMTAFEQMDSMSPVTPLSIPSVTRHPGTQVPGMSPVTYRRTVTGPGPLSPININTADSAQLLPLPGIGPVFAGRIIRYRNLLGGFIHVNQLYEVYGLKRETIKLISEYFMIDTLAIRKMYVDSASFRNLLRHPYLQLEDVKALVNYRDFRGQIDSIQEVSDNNLLPDSTLEKISPYLQFRR